MHPSPCNQITNSGNRNFGCGFEGGMRSRSSLPMLHANELRHELGTLLHKWKPESEVLPVVPRLSLHPVKGEVRDAHVVWFQSTCDNRPRSCGIGFFFTEQITVIVELFYTERRMHRGYRGTYFLAAMSGGTLA